MLSKNFVFSNNLIELSKKAAILEKDEEFYLINDWRDNKTPKSLQKILNSYLRLLFHMQENTLVMVYL